MKIVHATWEKRNFGHDAYEVTLDRKDMDDVSAVIGTLSDARFNETYVCVKLPVGNLKIVHALEDLGFRFLETQLSLIDHFTPEDVYTQREKFSSTSYRVIEKKRNAWERIIQKITPGLFDTDRIALDPMLGPEIACRRYQNWMRDLFDNHDSRLVVMEIDGEEAGFSLEITRDGRIEGILGGMFENYRNSGYGMMFMAGDALERSKIRSRTAVSSNNLSVLRVHQNCGRIVYKEMYVLRRFNLER